MRSVFGCTHIPWYPTVRVIYHPWYNQAICLWQLCYNTVYFDCIVAQLCTPNHNTGPKVEPFQDSSLSLSYSSIQFITSKTNTYTNFFQFFFFFLFFSFLFFLLFFLPFLSIFFFFGGVFFFLFFVPFLSISFFIFFSCNSF